MQTANINIKWIPGVNETKHEIVESIVKKIFEKEKKMCKAAYCSSVV